ncbi:hypothetical protein [Saccharolobus caldissimus]|nr:hypothetical protein [Saccharolobus caldissimus]
MKTLGPSYTELGKSIMQLLKRLDELIEKGDSSELLELAITAKEQVRELQFNLDRLVEYLEEERIERLMEDEEE